jgi:hypothetical protein
LELVENLEDGGCSPGFGKKKKGRETNREAWPAARVGENQVGYMLQC